MSIKSVNWNYRSGPPPLFTTCTVSGCDRKHVANGLCDGCRQRQKARCLVDACDRPAQSKGLCTLHYKRDRRGADLDKPPQKRKSTPRPPGIEDCWKCVEKGKLCDPHHKLLTRYKLTRDQYLELVSKGCGVCGALRDSNGTKLVIDHDHNCCPGKHTCGECVRGMLCTRHNIMAGFLEAPDASGVQAYLEEWSKKCLT